MSLHRPRCQPLSAYRQLQQISSRFPSTSSIHEQGQTIMSQPAVDIPPDLRVVDRRQQLPLDLEPAQDLDGDPLNRKHLQSELDSSRVLVQSNS